MDDELIEHTRDRFDLNLVDSDGYVLGSSTRIEISIKEGVCDRTPQVAEAIRQLGGQSHCSDVSDPSVITRLSIVDVPSLTTLKGEDFFELDSLQRLDLNNNGLTTLPAGVFDALGRLTELRLNDNGLTTLPAGVFDALGRLTELRLNDNGLTTLPAGVFDALGRLTELRLNDNGLTTLPAGVFDGLGRLTELRLNDNGLTTLPAGLFSDLERVTWLAFHDNHLTALPPGTFSGPLSNLMALTLGGNLGSPFQLKLRLEFADEEQAPTLTSEPVTLRATLREGAPYALAIGLQAAHGTLSTTEVTIEAGSTWSSTFTVTRFQGESSVAVSFADVSPPPDGCPSSHQYEGQCFSGFEIVSDAEFVLDDQPLSATSGVAITSAPRSGDTYAAGNPNEEIVVEIEFSEEIDVVQANDGSWPSLALEVGNSTRVAAYDEAASSTDKLVFRYKPQAADNDDDGISVPDGALRLNGALILDAGVPVPPSSLHLGNHAIQNAPNHKVNSEGVNLKIRVFLEGALE